MSKPYKPYYDLTPSMDEAPGANFEIDIYGTHPVTKEARIVESEQLPELEEVSFNDTFQDAPTNRERRLREAGFQQQVKPQPGTPNQQLQKPAPQDTTDQDPNAQQGPPAKKAPPPPPPTDPAVDKKIVDGEHQTLMSIGQMPDPQPEDNHQLHNTQHRTELANPKLSETQRAVLVDHIQKQSKMGSSKAKSVNDLNSGTSDYSQPSSKQKESSTRGAQRNLSMAARENRFLNAKKVAFGGR